MLRKILFIITIFFYSGSSTAQPKNCITSAAQCFDINPLLIRAIIWQESKNIQGAVSKNTNNTVDVGVMQINSVHFKSFNAIGVSEEDLRNNSCANVFAGTWILKQSIQRYGYSWDSIGRYHSSTPEYQNSYVNKIINIIVNKRVVIESLHIPASDMRGKFKCINKLY